MKSWDGNMTEDYKEMYNELRSKYDIVVKNNGELIRENRKLGVMNAMLKESAEILHEEIEELKNELNDSGKSLKRESKK